jgi:hypothetical protein
MLDKQFLQEVFLKDERPVGTVPSRDLTDETQRFTSIAFAPHLDEDAIESICAMGSPAQG